MLTPPNISAKVERFLRPVHWVGIVSMACRSYGRRFVDLDRVVWSVQEVNSLSGDCYKASRIQVVGPAVEAAEQLYRPEPDSKKSVL